MGYFSGSEGAIIAMIIGFIAIVVLYLWLKNRNSDEQTGGY